MTKFESLIAILRQNSIDEETINSFILRYFDDQDRSDFSVDDLDYFVYSDHEEQDIIETEAEERYFDLLDELSDLIDAKFYELIASINESKAVDLIIRDISFEQASKLTLLGQSSHYRVYE